CRRGPPEDCFGPHATRWRIDGRGAQILADRIAWPARPYDRLLFPLADRRYHSIPQSRNCLDVLRAFWVIAKQAAECCYSLIDRILCDKNIRPSLIQQILNAHNLACALGEANQQPHRPHFYLNGFSIS